MFLQIAITLFFFIAIIGIFVWFFQRKGAISQIHNENVSALETAISTNKFQINIRNSNLNNYDFLKFNLNDALIVQPEIQT